MTMLDERTESVTFDLDDEPQCSDTGWVNQPETTCPNPARWQYRGLCGHPDILCDDHHTELINPRHPGGIECDCGVRTRARELKWRHL